jgi:hypothetical protein
MIHAPDPHDPTLSQIDDGLRALPLTPAPSRLVRNVMIQVRALAQPRPQFALTWLDLALPVFATLCITLILALGLNLLWVDSGRLVIRLAQTSLVALQQLGPVTSLSLVLGLTTLFCASLVAGLARWVWRT